MAANATTITTSNITDKRVFALTGGGQKLANNADSGWIAPTLLNSWANFGSGFSTAGYRKMGNQVLLKGKLAVAISGTVAFVLPTGFRPTAFQDFGSGAATVSGANFAFVRVDTSGNVSIYYATSTATAALENCLFTVD